MLAEFPIDSLRLHSLGNLSQLLQESPGTIEAAAQRAGVHVAVEIDGRHYFNDADISSIRRALSDDEQ